MPAVRRLAVIASYVAVLGWLTFLFTAQAVRTHHPFVWQVVPLLAVAEVLAVVVHEAGHAVAVLCTGQRLKAVQLGIGPRRFGVTVRGCELEFLGTGIGGGRTLFTSRAGRLRHAAAIAAGPLTNLAVAGAVAVAVGSLTEPVAAAIICLNVIKGGWNLVPGPGHEDIAGNDGSLLLRLIATNEEPLMDVEARKARMKEVMAQALQGGDPAPFLAQVENEIAIGRSTRPPQEPTTATRRLQLHALAACDRYAEAADVASSLGNLVAAADASLCAALLGQVTLSTARLSELEGVMAVAVREADLTDNRAEQRGRRHGLAAAYVLQGRSAEAIDVLTQRADVPLPPVALPPERGLLAVARLDVGQNDSADHLLAELRRDSPRSAWTRLVEQRRSTTADA